MSTDVPAHWMLSKDEFERIVQGVLNGRREPFPKGKHTTLSAHSRFRNPDIARRADELVDAGLTTEGIQDRLIEEFGGKGLSRSAVGRYARKRRLKTMGKW